MSESMNFKFSKEELKKIKRREKRSMILGALQCGVTPSEIKRKMGFSYSTIKRAKEKRFSVKKRNQVNQEKLIRVWPKN